MTLAPVRRHTLHRLPLAWLVLVLFWPVAAPAQQTPAKRPLTHKDYDSWRSIQGQQLSADGKYLAYVLSPQEGDGEVVARNLATGKEWRQPRGGRQRTTTFVRTSTRRLTPGRGLATSSQLVFTADSRNLLFLNPPSQAETDKARQAKTKPEDMPKTRLCIMELATGKVTRIEGVKSFQVAADNAGVLAYLRESGRAGNAPDETNPDATAPARQGRGRDPRRAQRKVYGTDLVICRPIGTKARTVADVLTFTLSKDGKSLVYVVSSKEEGNNGVFAINPESAGPPSVLLKGKGQYTHLTWDEKQSQLAFLSDKDEAGAAQPRFKVYHWDHNAPAAAALFGPADARFHKGMVLSTQAGLSFSADGARLYFGVAPAPAPKAENKAASDEDKVVVDLWHWKDDFIQPMQKVRAAAERNRSYRGVYHFKEKKVVQLADAALSTIALSQDSGWAIGSDDRPYRVLVGQDTNYFDYYLVNCNDGSRRRLLRKQPWGVLLSPGGKYALFYDGKDWNSLSIAGVKITNLTRGLGVGFGREDHDQPSTPPPYGLAGWCDDDRHVLLYDRYDLWRVAADGSGARNLTAGFGRKNKIQLRYVRLDPQEKAINLRRPLLLRAENETTRDTGFYRAGGEGGEPQNLIMAARNFSLPVRAKNADTLVLTASTFDEFPDLLVTGTDFKDLKKVTNANPQKARLLWGKTELVCFKNADGVPLRGVLIKPENFDPKKKYPLLVYIYERLSQNLHHFVDPRPGTSINLSYYASNGYLVFLPDIFYTVGYPGQSALKCVLPGIQAVVDRGFVDEKAIGIQGHSWGGYQIAYMVTQTQRFKAAAAGAPVANMTSAYSGIRWGSGLPRQFQYEKTQSRIGGSLWQYPMRFVENSPVFMADRVRTPLLMLHNDQDDAVPWYQGIEYFLALRRLGKEAYLFNYNGEPHGLRKRVNQKDYTVRLQQFFDHHLKGAAKPAWMEKGIPYRQREPDERRRPVARGTEE
jgi:dienelactone hydrolase